MAVSRWLAAGVAAGAGLLTAAVGMAPAISGGARAAAAQIPCDVTAKIESQWGSGAYAGEIVTFTLKNTAQTATSHWSVTWTLGGTQSVTASWNATVSVSGTTVTATNASFNGVLLP